MPLEVFMKITLSRQQYAAPLNGELDLASIHPCGGCLDSGGVGVVNWGMDVVMVCAELTLVGEHQ